MTKRVLVVGGLGAVGQKHVAALKALRESVEVTVVDPAPGSLPAVRHLDRLELLGRSESFDLAVVAIPPSPAPGVTHWLCGIAETVLVEKPVAVSEKRLTELGREVDGVLVALQVPFAHRAIVESRLAESSSASISIVWPRRPAYFSGWRSGAQFVSAVHQHAVHGIDLLRRIWRGSIEPISLWPESDHPVVSLRHFAATYQMSDGRRLGLTIALPESGTSTTELRLGASTTSDLAYYGGDNFCDFDPTGQGSWLGADQQSARIAMLEAALWRKDDSRLTTLDEFEVTYRGCDGMLRIAQASA